MNPPLLCRGTLVLLGCVAIGGACAPGDAELRAEVTRATDQRLTWSVAAPLPEPRTEVSVTTDGRRVYLAGGFAPPAETGERASAPTAMWGYDPAGDVWEVVGDIPEGLNHAGLVHVDGRLYLIGGFRETTFEPVADVRVFDLESRSWSTAAPMPTPRGAMGVTVLDGRIHAIGGNVASPDAVHDHERGGVTSDNSVGTHEVYDPTTDRWERRAPMPTSRNHLGAASALDRVHAVGGRAEGDFELTVHEVYDPTTDTWEPAPPVPTGRSGVAVVEAEGSIYMFGGETFGSSPRTFADAERYDPSTREWEVLPSMPTARHGLGAAAVGDRIHVLSGGPGPGFTFGTFHEVLGPLDGSVRP